jgi:hypothetical protein
MEPFRDALDKKDRKKFEEMCDIPKFYISACSNSVQLVPLHPMVVSILSHHYRAEGCILEVEQMTEERRVNIKQGRRLLLLAVKEEQKEQALLTDY